MSCSCLKYTDLSVSVKCSAEKILTPSQDQRHDLIAKSIFRKPLEALAQLGDKSYAAAAPTQCSVPVAETICCRICGNLHVGVSDLRFLVGDHVVCNLDRRQAFFIAKLSEVDCILMITWRCKSSPLPRGRLAKPSQERAQHQQRLFVC